MLHEKRGHLAHLNAIGELCAQFRKGIVAVLREIGPREVLGTVEAYHQLHPEAADAASWFPEAFEAHGHSRVAAALRQRRARRRRWGW